MRMMFNQKKEPKVQKVEYCIYRHPIRSTNIMTDVSPHSKLYRFSL